MRKLNKAREPVVVGSEDEELLEDREDVGEGIWEQYFMVGEDKDDFLFGDRRRTDGGESVRAFGSSLGCEGDGSVEQAGESDLCSEKEEEDYELDDGIDVNLCSRNSLQLEYEREEADQMLEWEEVEADETVLEWEEVGDGGLERDAALMTMAIHGDENDDAVESLRRLRNEEVVQERVVTAGWEVLLNADNMMRDVTEELGNNEYETLFWELAAETRAMVNPPAAISVVQNLAVVVVTQMDVDGNNAHCAVCRDEMGVGEKAKRLPCSHRYHGDCIVPWLDIRNTCPVCRFELLTDDAAYERWRTRRA